MVVRQLGADHAFVEAETNVPAGMTATREFNLAPYFDLREPGNYTVKARIKIPEWGQEVPVEPVAFTIIKGTRLENLPGTGTEVGVPLLQSESGQPPQVRRYYLERTDATAGMRLYVRLTDGTGAQTMRLVPIGPYFSYSQPEVKLDRFNDLHVLHQTGGKEFTYCVIDTLGQILERHTYQYIDRRPALLKDADGGVHEAGGARVVSDTDLPPPSAASAGGGAVFRTTEDQAGLAALRRRLRRDFLRLAMGRLMTPVFAALSKAEVSRRKAEAASSFFPAASSSAKFLSKLCRRVLTLRFCSCLRALLRMRRPADFVFGILIHSVFPQSRPR